MSCDVGEVKKRLENEQSSSLNSVCFLKSVLLRVMGKERGWCLLI